VSAARILDGRAIAEAVRHETRAGVRALKDARGITPKLSVILVGEDPASQVYVRNKESAAREAGMATDTLRLPASISPAELRSVIERLNRDDRVHGILVQLPLPRGLDPHAVVMALDPAKDVDGLHPENVGRLLSGLPGYVPCTPAGVIEILKRSDVPLAGAEAVVIGRSDIVGKPMAILLLRENATVTVCHSRTRDLAATARRADVLIAAIGRPGLISGEHIKPGAVVIDVGVNRCTSLEQASRFWPGDGKRADQIRTRGWTFVGDVHPAEALVRASAITPVPGGVGPMTIAMLLSNTLRAASMAAGPEAAAS
jgi:methylenetetrahydrofolate dehydrogenase (NADP+)/methenyltetrahydrofolate cyclohydrolase